MKRLVLKQADKKITGLCAGIADYFNLDPTVIRLIALVLIIMSGVLLGLLIYVVLSAMTPKEGDKK